MKRGIEKISVSLPADVLRFAEDYRKSHGLPSRSEVLVEAIKALRERELAGAFDDLAEEYATSAEPLLDSGLSEGLEHSDGDNW